MSRLHNYSIIIPVYNSADTIEQIVRSYYRFSKTLPDCEFIIAEDGSVDGTKSILSRLKKELSFTLVSGRERKGYVQAVKDALKIAKGRIILFSDAGGHYAADFSPMLKFVKSYDIVSGRKAPRKDPFARILYSNVYNTLVSVLFLHVFRDIDSGFKVYRKEVIDAVLPECVLFKDCISTEILLRAVAKGYKVKEVPVRHILRNIKEVKTFKLRKLPSIFSRLIISLVLLRLERKHPRKVG
ncbi:MAG: glycosyltransferase [Candidatus Woesearchaeota archaeon]